jgi:hypothetical protein
VKQGSDFLRSHALAGLLVRENGTWTTIGSWPQDAMLQESKKDAKS